MTVPVVVPTIGTRGSFADAKRQRVLDHAGASKLSPTVQRFALMPSDQDLIAARGERENVDEYRYDVGTPATAAAASA